MLSFLFSRIALVFVAFVAAAASIIALLFLVFPKSTFEDTPADLLPRDATLALLEEITPRELQTWSEILPVLQNVPPTPKQGSSVALFENGWAILQPRTAEVPGAKTIGQFSVQEYPPELFTLIERGSDRLSSLPTLRRSTLPGASQRIYIRKDLLPSSHTLGDDLLRIFVKNTPGIALHSSASGAVLVWENTSQQGETFSPWVSAPDADGFLALRNAEQHWTQVIDALPSETARILSSLAETSVHEHFGGDISWTFDVLPLLKDHTRIVTRRTESGALFLMEGQHDAPNAVFARMHKSVEQALPKSMIESNEFDARFSSDRLLADTSKITKKTGKENGWDVQDTTLTNGRGLVTAIRGKDFLVSNDAEWMRERLKETSPVLQKLPSQGTSILAGGQADATALRDHFQDSPLLTAILPSGGVFLWSLEQQNNVMMLRWSNR